MSNMVITTGHFSLGSSLSTSSLGGHMSDSDRNEVLRNTDIRTKMFQGNATAKATVVIKTFAKLPRVQ